MRIAITIVGIVAVLLGGLWILQGANVMPNTVMSGQSQWLYTGIVLALAGVAALIWVWLRRR